jgi:hypothetical protein
MLINDLQFHGIVALTLSVLSLLIAFILQRKVKNNIEKAKHERSADKGGTH